MPLRGTKTAWGSDWKTYSAVVILALVFVAVAGFVLGLPLWFMATAKHRGLGNERPKHPFELPPQGSLFLPTSLPAFQDRYRQEYLDLPPVSEHAAPEREPAPRAELSWSAAARNSLLNVRDALAERHAAAGLVHVLAVVALTAGALGLLAAVFAYSWR